MYRRLYTQLATLILLPALGGCVQMTRHSNMMIFGTNTVVGIKAGVNAQSIPEVQVGFTRQEAVILPLVANVASQPVQTVTTDESDGKGMTRRTVTTTGGDKNRLEPCNLNDVHQGVPQPVVPGGYLVHPCSLVGINGTALDSYSVLASFGGHFTTTAESGKAQAAGGVAQYFSTGIAAQTLALNGGASVVASSHAAEVSGQNAPVLATTGALMPSKQQLNDAKPLFAAYKALRDVLASDVAKADAASLATKLPAFEGMLGGVPQNLLAACKTPAVCANFIAGDAYLDNFNADPKKFQDAVASW